MAFSGRSSIEIAAKLAIVRANLSLFGLRHKLLTRRSLNIGGVTKANKPLIPVAPRPCSDATSAQECRSSVAAESDQLCRSRAASHATVIRVGRLLGRKFALIGRVPCEEVCDAQLRPD